MDLKRNGSQSASRGPAEYFTGTVRAGARKWRLRHFRALLAQQLAHASARSDADRDFRMRFCAELGRAAPGHSAGGCRLVSARGEALARRLIDHGHDAHRHPGRAQWEGRGLARTSDG